jgi:hypothetical protein
MAARLNNDIKNEEFLDEKASPLPHIEHLRADHQEIVQRYEDTNERKRVLRKVCLSGNTSKCFSCTTRADAHKSLQIDVRFVPVMALLYVVSQVDRANIGNAKIEGLDKDLSLTGNQYNIASTIFVSWCPSLQPKIRV